MPKTLDLNDIIEKDSLATLLSDKLTMWQSAKRDWEEGYKETVAFLYADSTRDLTSASYKEFQNTTHLPKLTQIRDMLITYYLDAIFSLPDFVEWTPTSEGAANIQIKNSIKSVIKQILRDSGFKETVQALLEDYVDCGNCFVTPLYVSETFTNKEGKSKTIYEGPKAVRINPLDIFFDPTAESFEKAPKLIRKVMTIGELAASIDQYPTDSFIKEAFNKAMKNRTSVMEQLGTTNADSIKNNDLQIAGTGSLTDYYTSDVVELLTFYGDLYDIEKGELLKNHKIVVMDRCVILDKAPIKDLGFGCNTFKAGWRDRKDSLWSMSPLDNLKGMQYMIDFLENKRADIFNFISDPVIKTKGDVELPEHHMPGAEYNCGLDADVDFMRPDATVLQANLFINDYMYMMEEMAGTPREAMGFRTPGEKTAFEVSQLNTASSRLFNEKVRKFERLIMEPLLTAMLRMYLDSNIRTVKVETTTENGAKVWTEINLDTLQGDGKFVAEGSTTYTDRARVAQTLMQLGNSAIFQDDLVKNNFDPNMIAYVLATTTGLDKFGGLVKEGARIAAQLTMQKEVDTANSLLEEQRVRSIDGVQQANV